METLKRWFGWGAQPDEEDNQKQQEQRAGQWQHKRPAAAASQQGPLPPPVICDRPSGDGGIQGLDWFRHSMLQDTDGDCAHTFLEEEAPQCKTQREGAAAVRLQPQGGAEERGGQQARQQPRRHLQHQQAALQASWCTSCQARRVGPNDMLVDRGNVHVVPHSDHP
ncbi:hypothetical protein ABPG77_004773 [Micractinium sp. CCAP 211/92]